MFYCIFLFVRRIHTIHHTIRTLGIQRWIKAKQIKALVTRWHGMASHGMARCSNELNDSNGMPTSVGNSTVCIRVQLAAPCSVRDTVKSYDQQSSLLYYLLSVCVNDCSSSIFSNTHAASYVLLPLTCFIPTYTVPTHRPTLRSLLSSCFCLELHAVVFCTFGSFSL